VDEEEKGFLAGLKIPNPWMSGRVVESVHPVYDGYKLKETLYIKGASSLYLQFDRQCATQYDYDRVSYSIYIL